MMCHSKVMRLDVRWYAVVCTVCFKILQYSRTLECAAYLFQTPKLGTSDVGAYYMVKLALEKDQ